MLAWLHTPSLGRRFMCCGWFGVYLEAPIPPAPCSFGIFWLSPAGAPHSCPPRALALSPRFSLVGELSPGDQGLRDRDRPGPFCAT